MHCSLLAPINPIPDCFLRNESIYELRFSNCFYPTHNPFNSNSFSARTSRRLHCIDSKLCWKKRIRIEFKQFCHRRVDQDPVLIDGQTRWSRCSDFARTFASGIISFYLLCLNLVGEVHGVPTNSFKYACEDVSNYYASVEQKDGDALIKELNSIISNHHSLPYKEVWEALKILDTADVDNPEASSNVVEIYSSRAVLKVLAGKPEGWNREHLWPRSYGISSGAALTDLHNIRPADVNVNSSRGNKYYGECLSSNACVKPASKEAAYDTETDNERWAPPLQVRGDIARALMYMAIRYGFSPNNEGLNLHLSDSPSIKNREMGLLSTLLKWNELDPPSRAEQIRNNRVCQLYQHNRNPFVDHPDFAKLVWKQSFPDITSRNKPPEAWINEFHYNNRGKDQNEFVEIIVGPSAKPDNLKLVLYNGANGRVYRTFSLADRDVFRVTLVGNGISIYTVFVPLQNGPGDGISLVSSREDSQGGEVIQFVSYEGAVRAIDGPAKGIKSNDIGLEETNESSENDSLGLTGAVTAEFKWRKFINHASPSELNVGQSLS